MASRAGVVALGVASLVLYSLDLHKHVGREPRVLGFYVGVFGLVFVLYLAATWIVLRHPRDDSVLLSFVLGFGLLFRLVALPAPVVLSSDLYRYLWDGRVQWAGVNPYRYAPTAPELAHLRDDVVHPNINRPDKRTIYPPGAQAVFALVAAIAPYSVLAWRLFILACDVATGVLLLVLLKRMARPPIAVIVWAWAPLAIFEGVHAGHLDAALLPPVLLALLWRQEDRVVWAGLALGVAVSLKLYPAVLLPVWWRRREWRFPAACVTAFALASALYLGVGARVLGFLPEYFGRAEDFNVGLRFFLTDAIGLHGDGVRALVMAGLLAALLATLLRIRRTLGDSPAGVFRAGRAAATAWLLLVPTAIHPWYATWILPFLAVAPSAAWLWFTGAVSLSYLAYAWKLAEFPFWARALEFLPLYALLIREGRAQ